jgi:hypothetical protein
MESATGKGRNRREDSGDRDRNRHSDDRPHKAQRWEIGLYTTVSFAFTTAFVRCSIKGDMYS